MNYGIEIKNRFPSFGWLVLPNFSRQYSTLYFVFVFLNMDAPKLFNITFLK